MMFHSLQNFDFQVTLVFCKFIQHLGFNSVVSVSQNLYKWNQNKLYLAIYGEHVPSLRH